MKLPQRFLTLTLAEIASIVAVVAVLAAVAIPNQQEAHVRSQVAQVQRDIRTLFLAVEAYRVDNGLITDSALATFHNHSRNQHHFFTTPIAYMPHELFDPFYDGEHNLWNCIGGNIYNLLWGLYHYEPMNSNGVIAGWLPWGDVLTRQAYQRNKRYLTLSLGPGAMDFHVPGQGSVRGYDAPCGVVYDQSNGLLSTGDIIGFGPL